MNFYLDANIIVSLFIADSHSSLVDAWLDSEPGQLFVSDFARVEFAAVISRQVRVGAMNDETAHEALSDFDEWTRRMTQPVETRTRDVGLAERLARDFATKLSAQDALHLAIAANREHHLVTFDARLADAARVKSVSVVSPG